jgi:uncharacterized repeat protein (TIGR01451 family)
MGGIGTSDSGRSDAARHIGHRFGRLGRLTGRVTAAVAVGALALPVISTLATVGSGPATAAGTPNPALSCSAGTIYNLMTNGNFYALNTATGANTAAAPSVLGPNVANNNDNALGISANGATAYSMDQTPSGGNLTLTITTIATNAVSNLTVTAGGIAGNIAGGVDPANGNFYYGGWNSANTVFTAFSFNVTSHAVNEIGTITPNEGALGSGDLAFDGLGNLYVLAGSGSTGFIEVVNATSIPATSSTAALPFHTLSTLSGSGNLDGIAFAANGSLYAEDGSGDLFVINADTGAESKVATQTGNSGEPVDLASCAFNGTLTLEKNIVGRVGTADQFALSVTGGGLSSGNTATTSGSTTGLQTAAGEIAGPVVGIPGTVYTIAETGASGANLANYTSSYNCANGTATFASGTGTSATLPAFPQPPGNTGAQVVCTFTNTPASIAVTKTPSPTTVSASGQTVAYMFAITNTGPLTLTNVGVADAQTAPSVAANLGTITCTAGTNGSLTLASHASTSCTATYTVSQADINNGKIIDTATASGTAPGGGIVQGTAGATVTVTANPKIAITKSASVTSLSAPGTVTYTFTVTNSGNVSLSGVDITDSASFTGLSTLSCAGGETNGSISLAPGASEACTATESVSQAAIDTGTSLVDTASATGTSPAGVTPATVSASSQPVTVTITPSPALTVKKTASVSSVSAAGQTFTYNFAVKNTGNVDLNAITINDTQTAPSVAGNLSTISCPDASLAPGATENCTATYTVSQADMDAGTIADTATVSGTNGKTTTTSPGSGASVSATQSPSLSLLKTANVSKVSQVGQQVIYSFAVKNTGNVTVNAITINDVQQAPSLGSSLTGLNCPNASLAPNASEICTATYTVTQKDLNHGSITDTATASGKTTVGTTVTSNSSSVTIQAVQVIMSGRAYAIGADIGVTGTALVGPVTVADTGGIETAAATNTPTPCVVAAAVKDLTITGDVCAGVQTTTNPNASTATSSIANLGLGVLGLPAITLQAVQSTSTTTCAGSTGSVTIAYLAVGNVVVISKPTVIAPNTGLSIGVVSLVLNEQKSFNIGGDAGLTVNALHVQVNALGLAGVNLVVASSTSDIQCSVPTQAPTLTGEANDVDLLAAALGGTVGANVVVNDTSPVITDQATTTPTPCVAGAAVALVTITGNVCASVTTAPNGSSPASSTANASVANLVTGIPFIPVITVRGVASSSTTSCTASSGSVTIAYLAIGSDIVISAPTVIAPNTPILVGAVTLVLNQQLAFSGADTGLTVNAIAVSVNTGGLVQALGVVASSTSDILDC